ncbi:MAG: LamG domain-containing protein [Chthoniobacteraceae bacterium]
MNRLFLSLILQMTLAASVGNAEPSTLSTSPSLPLVFWAHYMPMVPHGHLGAHPYTGGNHDAWPFSTQYDSLVDEFKEDVRQALESGINGFQMLAVPSEAMYDASRQVHQETGQPFFVAPLWLDPKNVGQTADVVEKFQHNHDGDPLLLRVNGEPLHFVWNTGTDERVKNLAQELTRRGLHLTLAPTLTGATKLKELLDTPDWPDSSPWKAGVSWMNGAPPPELARLMKERLVSATHGYLYVPAIAAGYDSSNRPGQAIHVPFFGVKTLLQSLKTWIGLGFRQSTLITWNDPHESLEIPSSRNIWGHNLILRYYHGIAEIGKSPLQAPAVVVSYPAEVIRGDQLYFQVVGLPPSDVAMQWRTEVKLVSIGVEGDKPVVLSGVTRSTVNEEALIEMSWNAEEIIETVPAVQPVVSVDCRASTDGEWKPLYRGKKLPPIRLSYNLVRYPVPYAIDLSKIAETPSFKLDVEASLPLDHAKLTITGPPGELRRVMLCDQTRSLGAFRDGTPEKGVQYSNLYVRIEASEDLPLTLSVRDGTIADLFSPNRLLKDTILKAGQSTFTFNARPPGKEYRARVARLNLGANPALSLTLGSDAQLGITNASLAELKDGIVKTVTSNGRMVTVGMVLTTDATEPLIDYPLAGPVAERDLPLKHNHQEPSLLFAMGLLKNDQVVLSQPVWFGSPKNEPKVPVQWIDTKGTFDTFVNPASAVTMNPFTMKDIRTGFLPKSEIPFFYLDFEEGAGSRLNDLGTSQQPGRAFIALRSLNRDEAFENEANGRYKWIDSGFKGHALSLGGDTVIRFRSKSASVGAETLSLWVEVNPEKKAGGAAWSTLEAGDFRLSLDGNGTATMKFTKGDITFEKCGSLPLETGWNHLAFVYDLASVRLYHNGVEMMSGKVSKPVYQRTHQTPFVGFTTAAESGPGFTGAIDELQVIGTGIDAKVVGELAKGRVWR